MHAWMAGGKILAVATVLVGLASGRWRKCWLLELKLSSQGCVGVKEISAEMDELCLELIDDMVLVISYLLCLDRSCAQKRRAILVASDWKLRIVDGFHSRTKPWKPVSKLSIRR